MSQIVFFRIHIFVRNLWYELHTRPGQGRNIPSEYLKVVGLPCLVCVECENIHIKYTSSTSIWENRDTDQETIAGTSESGNKGLVERLPTGRHHRYTIGGLHYLRRSGIGQCQLHRMQMVQWHHRTMNGYTCKRQAETLGRRPLWPAIRTQATDEISLHDLCTPAH